MHLKSFVSTLAISALCAVATQAGASTLSNAATGATISAFGPASTETYGQVFAAPVTGTLDSFTLSLMGGVGNVLGAVGTWNGTPGYGGGFGSDATLYTSGVTDSGSGGALTFTPAVSVVEGQLYVAFLTVFGVAGASGATSMPLGTDLDGGGYFVWNNNYSPFEDSSWNYFANYGSVLFSAEFTPATVPVPAAGILLMGALCGLAAIRRRKTLA